MTFENAIKELEKIIEKLESGKLSVDESVELYTKGVSLCKECGDKLDEIKGKVALLEERAGKLVIEPVEVE